MKAPTDPEAEPAPPPRLDRAEFDRRRRHRSLITAGLLFAMVFLFYFITLARLDR